MLTILSIFGTRPEAVKMVPLLKAFARRPDAIRSVVCSTGQHREMLAQVLDLFAIRPDISLDIMEPDQNLAQVSATLLTELDAVVERVQPDWILGVGDTTTVFAAAMVAHFRRALFGHVEAGLRTGDLSRPFPEEANRRLTGVLAGLHFAPTPGARRNLLAEGVAPGQILVTGNTVIDALLQTAERLQQDEGLRARAAAAFDWLRHEAPLVLVTGHRRESFGPGFEGIGRGLADLAASRPDLDIVYPVHLNPRVREPVARLLGGLPNVRLIEPVDYLQLVYLLERCRIVITDSGGIQEEAPALGKPVLVMREKTERPEAIEAGTALLVGTDPRAIAVEARRLLEDPEAYARMSRAHNPFGDGHAAERIAEALAARFGPTGAAG